MIVRISGQLAEVGEATAVIEREGVARELLVPSYAVTELSASLGRPVTLHTFEYFEGSAAGGNLIPRLVGFLHGEDRAFFRLFTTVKGMGVRKALRALAVPVARLAADIEAGDVAALGRLPGIGKRMAEQIVAELRGKVAAHAFREEGAPVASDSFTSDQRDAIEILVAWGDGRGDAERWVARAAQLHPDLGEPEAWVRMAYRIKSGAV